MKMKQHPLSAAFPAMEPKDLSALQDDIQARGQMQPIIILDKMVLDGWHRYLCCLDLGIEPITEPLGKGLDPVAYVQSVNLHRRHLTGSQRAAAVVKCSEWAQVGFNQHRGVEPGSTPATLETMAQAADVSEKTIQQAKKAQEAGLGDAVRDGKVTAKQAAEIAKLPEPERQQAVEAPAPKAKPTPAPKVDDRDARIAQLTRLLAEAQAEIESLKAEKAEFEERFSEQGDLLKGAIEENESMGRVIDAGGGLTAMMAENKRLSEMARVTKSRNDGLMNENADLTRAARNWKIKFEKLQRQVKSAEGQGAGSEPEEAPLEPTDEEIAMAFGETA